MPGARLSEGTGLRSPGASPSLGASPWAGRGPQCGAKAQAGSGAPGFTTWDSAEVTGQNPRAALGGVAEPLGQAEDTLWGAW